MIRGAGQGGFARWAKALAAGGCALVLASCGGRGGDEHPPEPGDAGVAVVDDQTIWASDVRREAVAEGLIGEGEPLDAASDLFRRVLDEVVDQKLLAAEAVKRHLDGDSLAKRRLAAARERILGDMLVEGVVDQAVNDNAIRGLYEEQLKLAKPAQEYHVRQILTASQADADAARKLLTAGASFEALAMEKSIDSATRFNGGDLGYLTADVMPDAYSVALKPAKIGDVVGPFKTDAGWVLLKVEDQRLEKPITLEEARPQIVRFLTYDQVRELLEKLRSQSKVKVLIGAPNPASGAPREPASAPQTPDVTPLGPSTAESLMRGPPAKPIVLDKSAQKKTSP